MVIKNNIVMHLPTRQYSTIEWYEYRNYTIINTEPTQMTIDEYFEKRPRPNAPIEKKEPTQDEKK